MANNNVEIEIKFPLKNPDEVKEFLNKSAKLISSNVFQKDTYFIPVHRNFVEVKYPFEWLRLRESSKGFSINYKHFYPENVLKTDYCDEFESKIENIDSVKKIFKNLDIKELVTVEKSRTSWMFDDVEVVIDDVKNLGSYIELEATTNFDNPQDGKRLLYKILEKINAKLGDEDLRGYPYLMLESIGYKFN